MPEEVGGGGDGRHVAGRDERQLQRRQAAGADVIGDDVLGIAAAIERVEEPAVEGTVEGAAGVAIGGARRGRLGGEEVERDADLGVVGVAADDRGGQAVREEQVVAAASAAGQSRRPGACSPSA